MSFGVKCRKRILHLDDIKVKVSIKKEIKIWMLSWRYNIYRVDSKWIFHHWIIFNLRGKVHNNVLFLPSFHPSFLLSFSLSLSLYPSFPFFFTLFFFLSSLLPYFFLSVSFSEGRGELSVSLIGKIVRGKCTPRGFPSGAAVKNLPAKAGDIQMRVWSLG